MAQPKVRGTHEINNVDNMSVTGMPDGGKDGFDLIKSLCFTSNEEKGMVILRDEIHKIQKGS